MVKYRAAPGVSRRVFWTSNVLTRMQDASADLVRHVHVQGTARRNRYKIYSHEIPDSPVGGTPKSLFLDPQSSINLAAIRANSGDICGLKGRSVWDTKKGQHGLGAGLLKFWLRRQDSNLRPSD